MKWLDGYSGQSIDDLIVLASTHRTDSIVLACEQAVQQIMDRVGLSQLSEAEQTVLAVESLEREVNNGGHHQFFLNTPEYAPLVVAALQRIGCPRTAEIAQRAIAMRDHESGEALLERLIDECDRAYDGTGEPIADRLWAYICANRGGIRLAPK